MSFDQKTKAFVSDDVVKDIFEIEFTTIRKGSLILGSKHISTNKRTNFGERLLLFVIMAKAPRSRAGTTRNTATNPNQISRIHEDTLNLDLNLRAPPLRVPRTTSPNDQRQARRNFTVADPEIQQARRDFRNELESEEYQEDEIQQDEIQPFFDTQVQNSNSNDDDIFTENSSEEEEE